MAEIDKTYERSAFRLGRLYQQVGRSEDGKQMLDFMEEMEKNQSRYSQALITLQNHPEYPENHIAASRLQTYAGKPGIAVSLLKRARKRFPNDRHIKDELRQTLLDAGRKAEAGLIK